METEYLLENTQFLNGLRDSVGALSCLVKKPIMRVKHNRRHSALDTGDPQDSILEYVPELVNVPSGNHAYDIELSSDLIRVRNILETGKRLHDIVHA